MDIFSHQAVKTVLANLAELILYLDAQGTIQEYQSQGLVEPLGLSPDKIGDRFLEILPTATAQKFTIALGEARQTSRVVKLNFSVFAQNCWYYYQARCLGLRSDRLLVMIDCSRDRPSTPPELISLEKRYHHILETLQEGIWEIDSQGKTTYVNSAMAQMLGYPVTAMLDRSWFDFVGESNLSEAETYWHRRQTHISERHDFCFTRQDGSPLWTLVSTRPLLNEKGEFNGAIATIIDISDRKLAEIERDRQAQELQTLADHSPNLIVRFDRDLRFIYANPAVSQVTNYTTRELLGQRLDQLNFPDTLVALWTTALQTTFERNQGQQVEFEYQSPWGLRTYQSRLIPENNAQQVLVIGNDITHHQQTITALKDSEQRFRAFFEQAAIGVAKIAPDGRFLQANQCCCDLLGYTSAELQQRTCNEITHPDDRKINYECNLKLIDGETHHYSLEKRYIHKNGKTCWVKLTVSAVRDEQNTCRYFIAAIEDINDRKATEEQLSQQERHFRTLAENLPDIVARYNREYHCVYINPAIEAATGKPRHFFLNKPIQETTSTLERGITWRKYLQHTFDTQEQQVIDVSYPSPQGDRFYQAKLTPELNREGEVEFVLMVTRDVTEQQQALNALQESEQKFRRIFEQAAIGLNRADLTGRYIQVNQKFCELMGYTEAELLQLTYRDITHPNDINLNLSWMKKLYRGEISHFSAEKRLICKSGAVKWINLTVSLVRDAQGQPLYDIGIIQDISDRKAAEARLVENALYDPVTQLPNRTLFKDRLKVLLERARSRTHPCFAVLSIDLDRFKLINDSLGHSSGDEILATTGQLLSACLGPEDTLARFGGDEFMILLPTVRHLDEAIAVAERIQSRLHTPFSLQGQEITISASIGLVMGQNPLTGQLYSNYMDLLRDADMAMYRAKQNGKACYYVFKGELHHESRSQLQLESELRQALRLNDGQLQLHYQPIVDLQNNQLLGFEALARWYHPSKGSIPPGRFIPAAEESHLIVELGAWILQEACQQIHAWNRQIETLYPHLTVSVNLAGRQLAQAHLTQQISQIIATSGIDPQHLCLEITEVAIMENITSVLQKLEKFKSLGLKLSIDDFGTGYSSLSRLQSFPIDTLKVDRSFVKDVHLNSNSREIVKTILNLASGLGLNAIAEGIELGRQQTLLREFGCSQGQGFLFAKPMTPEAATRLLAGEIILEHLQTPAALG
ncbi:MAG: PAS domain S-box protein [Spirulinaceae cyanobacterium]